MQSAHDIQIQSLTNHAAGSEEHGTSEAALPDAFLLESLRNEMTAHFAAFSGDFHSSKLLLQTNLFEVRADEVAATFAVTGEVNGKPFALEHTQTVNIKVARNNQAGRSSGSSPRSATGDAAAKLALGNAGLLLTKAIRIANARGEQRERFAKGEATAEEIQAGAEAAASELSQTLCDATLNSLDEFVGRATSDTASNWKTISAIRWLFTILNFIGISALSYVRQKHPRAVDAMVFGAISIPLAFFVVHFSGLVLMPKDFFTREAAGRAAMKLSGVKSVFALRILSVVGSVLFLVFLMCIWWFAFSLVN